ncbi:hypothetical protein J4429_05695 [Candidatus Pacearchaeota archaeon]|nr:hypothetical protein [Candidatus Pacearchaeota archaeon]
MRGHQVNIVERLEELPNLVGHVVRYFDKIGPNFVPLNVVLFEVNNKEIEVVYQGSVSDLIVINLSRTMG